MPELGGSLIKSNHITGTFLIFRVDRDSLTCQTLVYRALVDSDEREAAANCMHSIQTTRVVTIRERRPHSISSLS
jgi:hypothetical protein